MSDLTCECSRCVEWKAVVDQRTREAAESAAQRDSMRREVVTLENRLHALETLFARIEADGPATPYQALARIMEIVKEAKQT